LQACGLGLAYPKGLVQTYLFEAEGKKILYMSSAGATEEELLVYRQLEVDYFLAPLQGHSSIQEIVAKQTAIIQPKVVIPHHHDDFFPPLSQNVSVDVFREKLKQMKYQGDVLEIPLFKSSLI
jgi:L-ascorbate metabolism protein UlaG (beta-lactamase superfamily)